MTTEIPLSRFRGFGKEVSYIPVKTVKGSICKACPNLCQLHYVEVPKGDGNKTERLIYGDACDRYQNKSKRIEIKEIEDLLNFRHELMHADYPLAEQDEDLVKQNRHRVVAIPAGLHYWVDFPFWNTFLKSLGCQVVISKANNSATFDDANSATNVDSCLPLKMYYGLVADVIKRSDVTDVFLPAIFNYRPLNDNQGKAYLCPLVTGVNHLVRVPYPENATDQHGAVISHTKRFLSPELFLDTRYADNKIRLLTPGYTYGIDNETIKQLYNWAGLEFGVTKQQVAAAYYAAQGAQKRYKAAKRKKGQQVLEELKQKNEDAIVLFGRSYNSFDRGLNMKLDFEVRKLGWQVIPFDFLPLEEAERSLIEYRHDNWFFQGNLLAAAEIVKKNPLLHAIYITNFKCGADGFIIKDMERTLPDAGKLMILEIDDLVNSTGYRTRIEAFIRSITLAKQKQLHSIQSFVNGTSFIKEFRVTKKDPVRYTDDDLKGLRLLIPLLSDHSIIVAGALRFHGMDATHFPPMNKRQMEIGRAVSNGKECLPFTITAGEIIDGLINQVNHGYDPKELAVLWMITEGPCRFNQYGFIHQYNIDNNNKIVGARMINLVNKYFTPFNSYTPGLRITAAITKSYMVGDYLQQMLHQTRPYEIHTKNIEPLKRRYLEIIKQVPEDMSLYFPEGALDGNLRRIKLSEMIYQVYIRKIADVILDKPNFEDMIAEFISEMQQVPVNRERKRPLIGMVGEIYLRMNPFANGDIIRKLEHLGVEVHLAPFSELLFYGTQPLITLGNFFTRKYVHKIKFTFLKRIDAEVFRLFKDALPRPYFGQGRDVASIVEYGRLYSAHYCAGEGPLTLGAMEEYCRHGADGVIMIGPMGCLPNITFKGLFDVVKNHLPEELHNMPRMEITVSESLNFKNVQTRIEPFVNQAKEYLLQKGMLSQSLDISEN